jgi:hypothetical protein
MLAGATGVLDFGLLPDGGAGGNGGGLRDFVDKILKVLEVLGGRCEFTPEEDVVVSLPEDAISKCSYAVDVGEGSFNSAILEVEYVAMNLGKGGDDMPRFRSMV